jgi:hypothetical protein
VAVEVAAVVVEEVAVVAATAAVVAADATNQSQSTAAIVEVRQFVWRIAGGGCSLRD